MLELASEVESSVIQNIIQREKQQNVALFGFSFDSQLLSDEGFTKDTFLDWSSLKITQSTHELKLNLKASKIETKKGTSEGIAQIEGFKIVSEKNGIFFSLDAKNTANKVRVLLETELENGSTVKGLFVLNLAPKSQIFDIVMDFGSEASQVVVYRRGSDHRILSRLNLVDIFTNNYYQSLKSQPLHQFVAEDLELYRSAFFVKKSDSVFDLYSPPGINGSKEFLNLLTNRNDIESLSISHFLISNLKLAHLGAYQFRVNFESEESNHYKAKEKDLIDTIGELQQAVINYVLIAVLNHIQVSIKETHPVYLSVRLLVPNVFGQIKVSKLVKNTLKSLDIIAEKNAKFRLSGTEVNTISESDASFLGFKQIKDNEVAKGSSPFFTIGKRYLIIDAGKGTTDFSIVELGDEKNNYKLSSLYRSGFIGAGNVISFAFVDSIFATIFGENTIERQTAIFNICLSNSVGLADKIRFIELIEKLKYNYKQTQTDNYVKFSSLDLDDIRKQYEANPTAAGLLESISKLIDPIVLKGKTIEDEHQIIHDTVAKMVNRLLKELSQTKFFADEGIEKIILTGRGFSFKPLVDKIKEDFKIPVEITNNLKKVCLMGAFSGEQINFDSNLIGYPDVYQILNKTSSNGQADKKVRVIDTGEGRPKIEIPILNNLFERTQILKLLKQGLDYINQELTYNGDEFSTETIKINNDRLNKDSSEQENFFNKGQYYIDFIKDAKTISICGIDYKDHTINAPRINICYTGNGFLVRDERSSSNLDAFPRFFETDTYVFQTLFPFLDVQDIKKVGINRLK